MHLSCEEEFSGALVHMAQAIVPGPEVKAKGHDFRRVLYIWWRQTNQIRTQKVINFLERNRLCAMLIIVTLYTILAQRYQT